MVQPLDLQVFARVQQIAGNLQLEQVERTNAEDALSNRLDRTNERLNDRVDAVAHDVQQEQVARTAADDALSQRLGDTNAALDAQVARLDSRVDTVAGDLQTERETRSASENDLSNRLAGTNAELNHQAARLDARVDAVARRLDEIREAFDDQIAAIRTEIEDLEDLIAYFEYCAFAAQSPLGELLERIGITTVEQLREREPEELHNELSRSAAQEPHYQAVPAVRRSRVTDEIIRWARRAPSGDNGRPASDRLPVRRRRPGGRGTKTD